MIGWQAAVSVAVLWSAAVAGAGLDDPQYTRAIDASVADRSFKVEIYEDQVRVTDRSRIVRATLAERDAMREAVRNATGCSLADELYPMDGRLRGRLTCSSNAPSR